MADFSKSDEKITITMDAASWMAVHGSVCLGLRYIDDVSLPKESATVLRELAAVFLGVLETEWKKVGLYNAEEIEEIHRVEQKEARNRPRKRTKA